MRLRVLGNAGGSAPGRQLSSYLIDEVVLVDAGSVTSVLQLDEQLKIQAVLLTHGHLDHIGQLPFLLIHRYERDIPPIEVIASAYTHETVAHHLMNGRVWVTYDVATNGKPERMPRITLEPREQRRILDRYDVRAIPLVHEVPCQGYWISDGDSQVIVCGDTTTTDELWETANGIEGLGGILVECSWTDDELARITGHMSPGLLLADLRKLTVDVPVYVIHRKPGYEQDVERMLRAAGDDRLRYVEDGDILEF